ADLQSVPIGHSGTRPYSFECPAKPDDSIILAWAAGFVNCFLQISRYFFAEKIKTARQSKSRAGERKKNAR
ncbi:MAG: hypothetical protein ACLS5B_05945, partial [Faecalibacterium prausnitzii]